MTLDLDRFVKTFDSEDQLRKYLFKLFSKMPNTTGVTITHGSQEYGKDLIFYYQDALGDWQLNACVVKKDRISGSADDNMGARNVFHQVEQALDTPLINSQGENEYVARVYVISPWDCPQTTLRSIQGRVAGRSGQVKFLCGSELLEKFDEYWPEFRFLESDLLGSYVSLLQTNLRDSDPINFLGSQHQILAGAAQAIGKVYVRQNFTSTLQTLKLALDIPAMDHLLKPITEGDLVKVSNSIVFLANFASHPQVWDNPEEAIAPDDLERLKLEAQTLKREWGKGI